MDSKGFGEHGAEGKRKTGHQNPSSSITNIGKIVLAREARIEAQNDDTGEG